VPWVVNLCPQGNEQSAPLAPVVLGLQSQVKSFRSLESKPDIENRSRCGVGGGAARCCSRAVLVISFCVVEVKRQSCNCFGIETKIVAVTFLHVTIFQQTQAPVRRSDVTAMQWPCPLPKSNGFVLAWDFLTGTSLWRHQCPSQI
jgi:hypothetical protein